jgi:hypothetical protein
MSSKLKHDVESIYKITCLANNKIYVGESLGTYSRWYKHRTDLRKGNHSNKHLQAAWLKEGESTFKFEILEKLENSTKEFRLEREEYWCKFYDSYDNSKGYNNVIKEYPEGNKRAKRTKTRELVKVYQVCPETNAVIKIWDSIPLVAEHFSIERKAVDKMLFGALLGRDKRRGTSRGYLWIASTKYKPELEYHKLCEGERGSKYRTCLCQK